MYKSINGDSIRLEAQRTVNGVIVYYGCEFLQRHAVPICVSSFWGRDVDYRTVERACRLTTARNQLDLGIEKTQSFGPLVRLFGIVLSFHLSHCDVFTR